MQWRKWRKIASLWRFGLDAKSGLLEAGDLAKMTILAKNRQRAGDNGDKRPAPLETGDFGENGNYGEIGDFSQKSPEGWRYPECSIIFKLDAKSGPFKVDN